MNNNTSTEKKQPEAATVVPVQLIKVVDIVPDPKNQGRNDPASLARLAKTIEVDGLLQPVILRLNPDPLGEKYMLIAGERRWRAHLLLKRTEIEARVYTSEEQLAAVRKRAIENLDRENLNPIQQARQYAELMDAGMSQTEAAARAGVDQSTMSNRQRILRLPPAVMKLVEDEELTRAHAIALLRFEDFPTLCEAIARKAVENGTPSKEMEKGVPFADELVAEKLIGKIYHSERDEAQKKHPAYLPDEWGPDSWWYCMDRAAHDQLQREKSKRKREKIAKETAKAGGGNASKERTYPPMNRNVHEEIRGSDVDFVDLIPAEKKVLVLEWRGAAKPILVCKDKRLLQKLRDEKGDRLKKQIAFDANEALPAAMAKVKGMSQMPKSGALWGVLLVELYSCLGMELADKVAKAHGVPVFRGKAVSSWSNPPIAYGKTVDAWAKIPAGKLCQMVIEAVVANEVGAYAVQKAPDVHCLATEYLLGKPVRLFSAKSRELEDSKPTVAPVGKPAAPKAAKLTPKKAEPVRPVKKPRRVQITPELKQKVVSASQGGDTGAMIARRFGISLPSVQNIKKEAGLVKARAEARRAAKEGSK